ncbi:hypothetical protein B0H16DRAFT_1452206 [Mycena metata]|uniref:RNase III domain-containing protein n=1 Tax=Mycena metata TaxID=1033252 RepID=A0AAD7JSU9_9AGAR|nr:hypothetical protein B0H16DRAFT_1452206 [Mycena metata]
MTQFQMPSSSAASTSIVESEPGVTLTPAFEEIEDSETPTAELSTGVPKALPAVDALASRQPDTASPNPKAGRELEEKYVDPRQLAINAVLASPTYIPRPAVLVGNPVEQAIFSKDPLTLGCLEYLGDSRVKYHFAKRQTELFPEATMAQLNGAVCTSLSNATFQGVGHALGVDVKPVDEYCKGVGDGIEIYVELLGQARPGATQYWVNDVFTPVIFACMGGSKPRPTPNANPPPLTLGINLGTGSRQRKAGKGTVRATVDEQPSAFPTANFTFVPPE